jgi:hypothetical protein
MTDLTQACNRTSEVLAKVSDEQLELRTPCEKMRVDELVAHIGGWRWRSPPPRARTSVR